MTETSKQLSQQTKEILGETVVLGKGFEDTNADSKAYALSKRTGNQDDESFFDRVKDFFSPKPKEEEPLEVIQVPELKVTPAIPVKEDVPTGSINVVRKDKPKKKTKYTQKEMFDLAVTAGFTNEDAKIMSAIGMAESSGDSEALNDNSKTGDLSYGLFQINMIGDIGKERKDLFELDNYEQLYNAYTNASAAKKVFDSQGFDAWSVYRSGKYKKFLDSLE